MERQYRGRSPTLPTGRAWRRDDCLHRRGQTHGADSIPGPQGLAGRGPGVRSHVGTGAGAHDADGRDIAEDSRTRTHTGRPRLQNHAGDTHPRSRDDRDLHLPWPCHDAEGRLEHQRARTEKSVQGCPRGRRPALPCLEGETRCRPEADGHDVERDGSLGGRMPDRPRRIYLLYQ